MFLPKLATMNYWMCEYARQKGFQCADNFAQYMGADYDSNGDGQIDSDALRYVAGESEASYVTRITVDAALHDPRRQHALRVRRAPATTTSSPTTRTRPTPAAPSAPACSAARPARARRATPRSPAARARSGTSTATSAWAGRCRSPTRRRPDGRGRRSDGRAATSWPDADRSGRRQRPGARRRATSPSRSAIVAAGCRLLVDVVPVARAGAAIPTASRRRRSRPAPTASAAPVAARLRRPSGSALAPPARTRPRAAPPRVTAADPAHARSERRPDARHFRLRQPGRDDRRWPR